MKCDSKTQKPKRCRDRRNDDPDCVAQMQVYRRRPDVLANALREMGIAEEDDVSEPHEV